MSLQIPEHFVKQYSSNVFHLSQQKGSRLRGLVRTESHKGEEAFYDRIGMAVAQKRTSRHQDTPRMDTPHSRRRVTVNDYEYADLVDKVDLLRTINDPTNAYAQAAIMAMGRAMDDEIIQAATGNAWAGKQGTSQVALPNTQKIVAHDGGTGAGVGLNVETLRRVKQRFDENDVDESIQRYMAISSHQLENLLSEVEVTNADYNTVRALVQGEIDTYLGFKFVRLERLLYEAAPVAYDTTTGEFGDPNGTGGLTTGNVRKCFAWAQDGLLLSVGQDIQSRVDERADKSYSKQIYSCMSAGAVRMSEAKVVEVLCDER